jgi:tRNA pseudouridine38-40 synthase
VARYLLTIQYLGTRYAGWQTQKNATAIQQVIEEALTRLCGGTVRVAGAGRTDSGVHARGQTAHADIPIAIDQRGLLLGINGLLPPDIRVSGAIPVRDDFHARFDARGKTYTYRIWNSSVADVFAAPTHALVPGQLGVEKMQEAAASLEGKHDFRSFTVIDPEVSSTVRNVERIAVKRDGARIEIVFEGEGFLRYMVRRVAGLLIETGSGRLDPSYARTTLEPTFREARWTAPPEGLTLERVEYEEEFMGS